MEAKDTVMSDEQRKLYLHPSRTGGEPDYVTGLNWDIEGLLQAQAEISFEAGIKEMKEVMEWFEKHKERNSIDVFGAVAGYNFYIGKYEWRAKFKSFNK